MLHIKLKIGNDLHSRLLVVAEQENVVEDLKSLLKKLGLEKNRKSDRIIFGVFNGGDVKKFRFKERTNRVIFVILALIGKNSARFARALNIKRSFKYLKHFTNGLVWLQQSISTYPTSI